MLLATLQNPDEVVHDDLQLEDWQGAVSQLLSDGFRYVILHKQVPVSLSFTTRIKGWALQLFWEDPKIYEDDEVIIYDLVKVGLGKPSPCFSPTLGRLALFFPRHSWLCHSFEHRARNVKIEIITVNLVGNLEGVFDINGGGGKQCFDHVRVCCWRCHALCPGRKMQL